MTFESDSRKLIFNKILVWLNEPVTKNTQDFLLAQYDANKIIDPLIRLNQRRGITNNLVVIIDPGHGGKDNGAIGPRKACEKKIVLDIANSVKRKLECPKISVKLTRKWDSALSRTERTNVARNYKADIFVSIHINSARNTEASGVESYIMPGPGFPSTVGNTTDNKNSPANKFDSASIQLAYCVHRQILESTGAIDRGIRHARFDVLQDAPCPAILVECGFVSNSAEESNLTKKKYRETIADAITKGIQTLVTPAPGVAIISTPSTVINSSLAAQPAK
ncbi:MAG: N-acetylmuramoyl-L-alanine amidase [Kiritimatiellae bacterium]|nr:N-acetylmuramoyl-L-alanine amidase [Kiritimatiellia bacterium]MDD5522880.1 N-acetylmuramoyl-L-alanine amidase [Kiritimatiellia bacterium]